MNRIARAVAVALGLTTICLAWLVEPLVRSSHDAVYHWSGSPTVLFGPVALDVALVWAALTLLLLSAQGAGRWRVAVWMGVLVFLPWIVLRNLNILWPGDLARWVQLPRLPILLGVWLLLVLLWRPAFARRYNLVIEFASTVLAFVALSGVLFLTQFLWFWWGARSLNDPVALHRSPGMVAASDPHPRIIWIVLDELSYQQVYEQRYPGLQLPAFDALAAQAMVFTHTVPAGIRTAIVLPSLLTGQPVDRMRSSSGGRLSIHNPDRGRWEPFDEHDTVFQDALNAGYGTAVAGWFNPYCRILPAVLDQCYWTDLYNISHGLVADGTVGSNVVSSANVLLGDGTLHDLIWRSMRLREQGNPRIEAQIRDLKRVSAAADTLLEDRSANFVFLHLPIPHPPGIYSRATGQLSTTPTTYLDNLALADRYLAHVRSILEQNGEWDSSTVIVMGDHGWRTTLFWEHMPEWTEEEERASDGGKFDDRPAYIVKLAGEQKGARIDLPFRAVETRALMDALLAGKIRTTDELQSWVRQSLQHP